MATDKLWDLMRHATSAYHRAGLASYAISAVDDAFWYLKGMILNRPEYEVLGGPQKKNILLRQQHRYLLAHRAQYCMVPGARLQGGQALPLRGPDDGIDGINRYMEIVAAT